MTADRQCNGRTAGVRPLWVVSALVTLIAVALFAFGLWELRTSDLQARHLTALATPATFATASGPSPAIRFPGNGPYDRRLGYSRLPSFVEHLRSDGFEIAAQARFSPRLMALSSWGLFPIYEEKAQAGLRIVGRNGQPLFSARYPQRIYHSFDELPSVLVRSLLFIENRELLDPRFPRRNPAVEWDRLFKSALVYGLDRLNIHQPIPGGSTLATQLEKYRHSPGGVTDSPLEKLRQMATASLRAYRHGGDTLEARRQIVVDYFNSVPLAAVPGYGEVIGVPSGLELWYGADVDVIGKILQWPEPGSVDAGRKARGKAFKEGLSLLIAAKRPSLFLVEDHNALLARTESYLRLLADEGVISTELRDDALAAKLDFGNAGRRRLSEEESYQRKAVSPLRARLVGDLGLSSLYEIDRLDLTVETTIDEPTRAAVTSFLRGLNDPERAAELGMRGSHLLGAGTPDVVYSFSLYEREGGTNVVRVQADNLDQPFDVNDGLMLDLGSTAKLRTLASYLEIVANLHDRYAGRPAAELRTVRVAPADHLMQWALETLKTNPGISMSQMLDAAMERRFSASPHEKFFTGGGIHLFHNFDKDDDARIMPVRQAFHDSVNLVFIRLMREVVDHLMFARPGAPPCEILSNRHHPLRAKYLRAFALSEGAVFLRRFYDRYHGKSQREVLERVLASTHPTPKRIATLVHSAAPGTSYVEFSEIVASRLPATKASPRVLHELYDRYTPDNYGLNDRAFLSRVHPLELWTIDYLRAHPEATWQEVRDASTDERLLTYRWLFKSRRKAAQDQRIRTMLERETFAELHRRWAKMGYPFDSLVPSLATAIGTSADRPSALADLAGIILSDGVRHPTVRIAKLRFGEGTPYETVMAAHKPYGERVMHAAVAARLREALFDTVEHGTARRALGALSAADGSRLRIGGKTGTGDHRYKVVASDGSVLSSHVVSRAATFVFIIGDRFYGVVTAYVKGEQASQYEFTSALATQLFKVLAPSLEAVVQRSPELAPLATQAEQRRGVDRLGDDRAADPREPGIQPDVEPEIAPGLEPDWVPIEEMADASASDA